MKRRDFLHQATMGALLPTFFGRYDVKTLTESPWLRGLDAIDTDRVLVLVQMFGGNDGLNTVFPLDQLSALSTIRNNILIPENKLLALNGFTSTALHPALEGFRILFNENKLSVVQSVGYPSPGFSHFRATDIWMSASDAEETLYSGWLGRYLQRDYPNYPKNFPNPQAPDPLALQIGSQLTLTTQGENTPMGMSISSSGQFYDIDHEDDAFLVGGLAQAELAHIRQVAYQSSNYGDVVKSAYQKGQNLATYPTNNTLADQLKIVARLIKGGLKTRVYMVTLSGFDTHADQVMSSDVSKGFHAGLLRTLSEGIFAFQRDIEQMRVADRVLGMTFSEFGRRIRANASFGTDHGAAAPLFLFGTRLFGGVVGNNPTILPNMSVAANLPMQYDFRSIYSTILKNWFCVPENEINTILLRNFQQLRLINAPNCITSLDDTPEKIKWIAASPNPFVNYTLLEFQVNRGHTLIQIFDVEGKLVQIPMNSILSEGRHRIQLDTAQWIAGVYYARLQNGMNQELVTLIKAA